MFGFGKKSVLPSVDEALPGRSAEMPVHDSHAVSGKPLRGPFPQHLQLAMFGMGCFWGVERLFWVQPGVYSTAVGYAAGVTPNPTYEEICSGLTGHNEVVQVVFDPESVSYGQLLQLFWESHDPTQGMRQGPDRGTQYRSGIYTFSEEQHALAEQSKDRYAQALANEEFGEITTEVLEAPEFYFAEKYHQQYLHKNPDGYCSLQGTGVSCAAPLMQAVVQ